MSTQASGLYTPQQWFAKSPAKTIITFPGQGNAPQYSSSASGGGSTLPSGQTLYAFDAEILIEHHQLLRRTQHPVQTGASISDHAYIEPARLVLDIGMSDVMAAFYSPSTWTGSSSKSVSAYQTMLALQFSRIPLTITTRLRTYQSMLIESLMPLDSHKTIQGLRMRVEFGQIFMATVTQTEDSARPQDTQETNLGAGTTQAPTAAQLAQNNLSSAVNSATGVTTPNLPSTAIGAGSWSSANLNSTTNWYDMFSGK